MIRLFLNPLYWPLLPIVGIIFLLAQLPFYWQLWIGRRLGSVLWRVARKSKRIARRNLQLAFPNETSSYRDVLLRAHFESLGIFVIELSMSLFARNAVIAHRLTLKNEQHLTDALAKGQGVILVCAHFMCVELVGRLFSQQRKLAVVYRPQKIKILNYLNQRLMRYYARAIPRENIRSMIKALRENLPVFYAPDVDAGERNSLFIPFFGTMAATVTATPRLVKLTGASLIPLLFYREENGYVMEFQPALNFFPQATLEQECLQVNRALENLILKKPEQYLWSYKRYKTRPAGEKRFYSDY